MPTVTWNDIPVDLQERVCLQGVDAVGDLARWAYENRPCGVRNDALHDTLCALILYLLRSRNDPQRQIRSLPAILSSISYRQRCQTVRDQLAERDALVEVRRAADDAIAMPFLSLSRPELHVFLEAALAELDERSREAIVRKHLLGETYREIAKALFGPDAGDNEEGHVSVILTRARRRMRGLLRDARS